MRILASLILVAAVACGGSQKSETTDTPPESAMTPTPVEPTPTETTEMPPEEGAGEGTATGGEMAGGEASGDVTSTCDVLCTQILSCAEEAQGKAASDAEHEQFMQGCKTTCVNEDPAKLSQAQACIDKADGNCPDLFPCLESIE